VIYCEYRRSDADGIWAKATVELEVEEGGDNEVGVLLWLRKRPWWSRSIVYVADWLNRLKR